MAVEFDEQEFNQPNRGQRDTEGAVTKLVLKLGLAKTPVQANVVMVVVAVVAIGITVYLMLPNKAPTPINSIAPSQLPGQIPR